MTDLPLEVFGINLLVRLIDDKDAAVRVHCPKGATMLYGQLVSRGDGFDTEGSVFRTMPHLDAVLVFEEHADEPQGHSFTGPGGAYRLITLDDVLVALPPRWWRPGAQS